MLGEAPPASSPHDDGTSQYQHVVPLYLVLSAEDFPCYWFFYIGGNPRYRGADGGNNFRYRGASHKDFDFEVKSDCTAPGGGGANLCMPDGDLKKRKRKRDSPCSVASATPKDLPDAVTTQDLPDASPDEEDGIDIILRGPSTPSKDKVQSLPLLDSL